MSLISRLGVVLGIDTAEFQAGLGKAQASLNNFGAKVLGSRLGVAAIATTLTAAAVSAIRFADHINDVSQASELSVQTVLRLNQALMTNGGNAESASKFVVQFNKSVYDANHQGLEAQKAFAKLGVTMKDLRTLGNEALLDKTIHGFDKLKTVSDKTGVSMTLFSRAARGIDFKGVADDLDQTTNSFKDSEQAFKDIGTALDNLQRISFTLKTNFATNIGTPLKIVTDAFISIYNAIAKANAKLDEFLGKFATIKNAIPLFWFTPSKQIATSKDVKDDKDAQARLEREQELSKEYENQEKALKRQLLSMQLDVEYIGKQKTKLAEVNAEFAKGGKYELLRGTQLEKNAQAWAEAYDIKKQNEYTENSKRIYELETERLQLQADMASFSDIEQKKLMAQLDLHNKLNDEVKKGLILQEQADEIYASFQTMQKQEETTRQAQQTFSAGWTKAYNDYVEKSKDAAALGKQAFEGMTQSMTNALDEFIRTGKLNFKSLIGDMIQQLIRLQLQAQMTSLFSTLLGSIGNLNPFNGWSSGLETGGGWVPPAKAAGGDVAGGQAYLVGEKGPELMIPSQSGTIIPNHSLSSVMGNQPQVVYNGPYIQNLSAIDTQSATQFLSKNKQGVWAANQSAQRALPQSR